jgi:GntR family transcriptional repressor for pyruvate dehydrogenase complex
MTQIDTVQFGIENAIITGDFPSNTRLPSERELAVSFNTSRNSIREAIARLAILGIVSTRAQSGSYVGDIRKASLDVQLYLFGRHGVYSSDMLKGLLSLCACVETQAAETAASSQQHLAHALKLETTASGADYHMYLVSTAENPVFDAVFSSMGVLLSWIDSSMHDAESTELSWYRERTNQAIREGNSLLAGRSIDALYGVLIQAMIGPTKN